MSDRYTMVFSHEERERVLDIFERNVTDRKNYSLIDADLLTRLRATIPDTPAETP